MVRHSWKMPWLTEEVGIESYQPTTSDVRREDFRFARMKREPAIPRGWMTSCRHESNSAEPPFLYTCSFGSICHKPGLCQSGGQPC